MSFLRCDSEVVYEPILGHGKLSVVKAKVTVPPAHLSIQTISSFINPHNLTDLKKKQKAKTDTIQNKTEA